MAQILKSLKPCYLRSGRSYFSKAMDCFGLNHACYLVKDLKTRIMTSERIDLIFRLHPWRCHPGLMR
jgi:hypothetical protein